MAKRKGKKKSSNRISLTKVSNKKLNKLAKRGKLKNKVTTGQGSYFQLLQKRTQEGRGDTSTQPLVQELAEDIPLEEADYEYFSTPGRDFSFLSDAASPAENGHRKRKKNNDYSDDIETSYEASNRKKSKQEEVRNLLPIKDLKKGLIQRSMTIPDEDDQEEEMEQTDTTEEEEEKPLPALSVTQVFAQRQSFIKDKKQEMALLASAIIANPEENIGRLRELRHLLVTPQPEAQVTVAKLCMLTLMEVFKDIIPDYRIRPLTDKEKDQKLKKDTKKLVDFEEGLLKNYQHYLEFVEHMIKGKPLPKKAQKAGVEQWKVPKDSAKGLCVVGLQCMSTLLSSHPHFNYRTNIISVVVPFMNSADEDYSKLVCNHIKQVFKNDKTGDVSIEIVRLIGRLVKAKHFKVRPQLLSTFLSLKIKEVDPNVAKDNKAARQKEMNSMSRKEKKRKKQQMYLEKELESAAAETNKQQRLKMHTEIINMVFLTYFRVLKQGRTSELLSTVLEGLAKFAHLINLDFFDDLFAILTELVESEELSTSESLNCVKTAFTLLSGQGSVLNVDPLSFYKHLYKTITHLYLDPHDTVPVALDCLDLMINKRKRQVSASRMHAFIKRLTSVLLQHESPASLGLMAAIRNIIHATPRSDILFDAETQGSGLYLPELDDPEHCNANNTAIWEIHRLRHHYCPTTRIYAQYICGGAQSQGRNQLPANLVNVSPNQLFHDVLEKENTITKLLLPLNKQKKQILSCRIRDSMMTETIQENTKEELKSLNFYSHFCR